MMMISVFAIMAIGISNVSAQPPYPQIVIYPHFQTGTVAGTMEVWYQVNIRNAPHTDAEVTPPPNDKTWAWKVELTWNETVLDCPEGYIMEDTWTGGSKQTFFGYFKTWTKMGPTWVGTEYPNTFVYSLSPGYASVGCSMVASPDPTTLPVPLGNPQAGLHLGLNYDLPYTEGLAAVGYPANELNLFWIGFAILKDGPPASTRINVIDTTFLGHDATTVYHVGLDDAWFGVIGPHLHSTGSIINPANPVPSTWHELYPTLSNDYIAIDWRDDNPDGVLGYCDEILLEPVDPPGLPMWYHVEEVTVTLVLEPKVPGDLVYVEYDCCEDVIPPDPITNPVPWPVPLGTSWHEKYPVFCTRYELIDFSDDGDGVLDPSDQIWLQNIDTLVVSEYHIFDWATDIIVTPEPEKPVPEFPLGIGLMMIMALVIPTAYVWRLRRKVTKQ